MDDIRLEVPSITYARTVTDSAELVFRVAVTVVASVRVIRASIVLPCVPPVTSSPHHQINAFEVLTDDMVAVLLVAPDPIVISTNWMD